MFIWEWIKKIGLDLVVALVRKQGAALAVRLLAKVDPLKLADEVRPHLRKLFEVTGPDWQAAFAVAWRKVNKFVEELLADPNVQQIIPVCQQVFAAGTPHWPLVRFFSLDLRLGSTLYCP